MGGTVGAQLEARGACGAYQDHYNASDGGHHQACYRIHAGGPSDSRWRGLQWGATGTGMQKRMPCS